MSRAEVTRLTIIRSAERLFLARGFQHVSLRDIATEAGQRNPSAVSYHFGDFRGLVEAILERHSAAIQTGWLAMLAHADSQKTSLTLRELISMLVRPIVAKLDDEDGGQAYLALCAELVTSTTIPLTTTRVASGPGALELGRRIAMLGKRLRPELLTLRMMRIAGLLYVSILDYLRVHEQVTAIPRELFVDDLVDSLVTLISPAAPPEKAPRPRKTKR